MLSILCVRLTIKVKIGIPESFKVGWYPPKRNWVESPSNFINCCVRSKQRLRDYIFSLTGMFCLGTERKFTQVG